MRKHILSMIRSKRFTLRPWWHVYLKYFSEVGHVTKRFNLWDSRLTQLFQGRRRRRLAKTIPALSAAQNHLLQELNSNGFCRTTLETLGIDHAVLSYLKQLSKPYENMTFDQVKASNPGKAKYYWTKMNRDWKADQVIYDTLAKNKFLLDLLSKYFEEIPYFNSFEYMYSPPFPAGRPFEGSQNWHRDNNQRKFIKIFFSPFPLTRKEGPPQILPARLSTDKYYTGYPRYMTDEELFATGINPDDQLFLTGEPGTIYLVDTARCLHCGSRSSAGRHQAIVTFNSTDRYASRSSIKREYARLAEPVNQAMMEMYEKSL